jgi:hypothetical protein
MQTLQRKELLYVPLLYGYIVVKGLCILEWYAHNCHMFDVINILRILPWHLPRGGPSPWCETQNHMPCKSQDHWTRNSLEIIYAGDFLR